MKKTFSQQIYKFEHSTFLKHFNILAKSKLSIQKKLTKIIIFSLGEGNDVTGVMTNPWKETTLQTILK